MEQIIQLLKELNLGQLKKDPTIVTGGLLHKMFEVETDLGHFAIKCLNPEIMKREGVIKYYHFSEKVTQLAIINGIPVIGTFNNTGVNKINGDYYMVFPWINGKPIYPPHVSSFHCEQIGAILAQIHQINFTQLLDVSDEPNEMDPIDWNQYKYVNGMIDFDSVVDDLYKWDDLANKAYKQLIQNQIISHRDLDCKNVIWDDSNHPYVIDWEASGFLHPMVELIDVAMSWSGLGTDYFDIAHFECVIGAYLKQGGKITSDLLSAFHFGFKAKCEWLEYNMKRALGHEEKELGKNEVINTIKLLYAYEKIIPKALAHIKIN